MANDLGRLDDLNQLSRFICEFRPKPEEIQRRLDVIRNKGIFFSDADFDLCGDLRVVFCFFGGDLNDMIASALIGIALKLFEAFVKRGR